MNLWNEQKPVTVRSCRMMSGITGSSFSSLEVGEGITSRRKDTNILRNVTQGLGLTGFIWYKMWSNGALLWRRLHKRRVVSWEVETDILRKINVTYRPIAKQRFGKHVPTRFLWSVLCSLLCSVHKTLRNNKGCVFYGSASRLYKQSISKVGFVRTGVGSHFSRQFRSEWLVNQNQVSHSRREDSRRMRTRMERALGSHWLWVLVTDCDYEWL
jgi:hypothetical protein